MQRLKSTRKLRCDFSKCDWEGIAKWSKVTEFPSLDSWECYHKDTNLVTHCQKFLSSFMHIDLRFCKIWNAFLVYIYIIVLSTREWILYRHLVVVCCLKQKVCVGIVWGNSIAFCTWIEHKRNTMSRWGACQKIKYIWCIFAYLWRMCPFVRELQLLTSLGFETFQLATSSEILELTLTWAQGGLKVFRLFSISIDLAWSWWIPGKIELTCHLHLSWAQAEYPEQIRFQPIDST